jgi:hypothetical protein
MGFLANSGPAGRRALIVYPTVLFYVVLAWLVLNDAPAFTAPAVVPTLPPGGNATLAPGQQ